MRARPVYTVHQHFYGGPHRAHRATSQPSRPPGLSSLPARPGYCRCDAPPSPIPSPKAPRSRTATGDSATSKASTSTAGPQIPDEWVADEDAVPSPGAKSVPAEPASPSGASKKTTGACKTPLTHVYPRPIKEPGTYTRKTFPQRVAEVFAYFWAWLCNALRGCMPKINLGIGINLFRFNGG